MTACATAAAAMLLALPARRAPALPAPRVLAGAVVALVALALLGAGVPADMLKPRRWDEIVAGRRRRPDRDPRHRLALPRRRLLGPDHGRCSAGRCWRARRAAGVLAPARRWPSSPVPAAMSLTMLYGVAVIEVPPERRSCRVRCSRCCWRRSCSPTACAPRRPASGGGPRGRRDAPRHDAGRRCRLRPTLDRSRAHLGGRCEHGHRRLLVGPRLWPARLAARRPRAAAHHGAGPGLLEGTGARLLRRPCLAAPGPSCPPSSPTARWTKATRSGSSRSRSASRGCAASSSSLPGRRSMSPTRRAAPLRMAGGTFEPERGILRRGASYNASVYTPDPNVASWPRRNALPEPGAAVVVRRASPTHAARRVAAPGRRPAVTFAPFGSGEANSVTSASGGIPGHDAAARSPGPGWSGSTRSRAACARASTSPSSTSRPYGARAARSDVHREAGPGRESARSIPLRRPARLLPALLGRGGAAVADGRGPGPGRGRLLARAPGHHDGRVRRARPRRALMGRGLLPASRVGHLRPDARRRPAARAERRRRAGPRSAARHRRSTAATG